MQLTTGSFKKNLLVHYIEQMHATLVIRQKGESQNGFFKKTKHVKFSEKRTFLTPDTHTCVFQKIWRALRFAFSPYYRRFRTLSNNRSLKIKKRARALIIRLYSVMFCDGVMFQRHYVNTENNFLFEKHCQIRFSCLQPTKFRNHISAKHLTQYSAEQNLTASCLLCQSTSLTTKELFNSLAVRALDYQSKCSQFTSTRQLQGHLNLPSFRGRSKE